MEPHGWSNTAADNMTHVHDGFVPCVRSGSMQGTLTVVMEIAAHSRFLSTMELHPSAPLLLTAAQDGTATVWDLEELYENKVKVRHSCLWNNAMITGGTFGPKDEFYLSSYSAPVLGMFNCQTVGL